VLTAAMLPPTRRVQQHWLTSVLLLTLLAQVAAVTMAAPIGTCSCDAASLALKCSGLGMESLLASFDDCPFLQSLNLENNAITTLDGTSFNSLIFLATLNLQGNAITIVKAGTFAPLQSLSYLSLSNNLITIIEDNAFVGLEQLTFLNIGWNKLDVLTGGSFAGLGALSSLNLQNNTIKTLQSGVFGSLGSLVNLYLHNNLLETVGNAFQGQEGLGSLTKLTLLILASNRLTRLAGNLDSLVALEHLDLSDNQIASLDESGAVLSIPSLRLLCVGVNACVII
jgi:Leucine-rich repeat (LRR) protein